MDERATMTNMAAEIGGFTGIVAPDQKVVEFLMERRGMSENEAETLIEGLYSDPDAHYAHVIELDAAEIYPMVATPGDPGNGKFVRELNTPVPVEIAYGGTCTAGKNEDMDMYARVLSDALKQGKRVADELQVLSPVRIAGDARILRTQRLSRRLQQGWRNRHRAQLRRLHQCRTGGFHASRPGGDQRAEPELPGTQRSRANVSGESVDRGGQRRRRLHRGVRTGEPSAFSKAGAIVIEPSCGACINAGPGVSTRPEQVVISAQNRNFPGRSGPGQMYLASPLTVAASAIAGYIVEYEPAAEREPAHAA